MKEKEKWVQQEIDNLFGEHAPIQLKHAWMKGFNFAKEKMLDLCDAKNSVVSFTEINRLGEKNVP